MAIDLEKLRTAAQRVAASHGFDLVELDFAGGGKFRALRVFIEKDAAGRAKLAQAAEAAKQAMAAGKPYGNGEASAAGEGPEQIETLPAPVLTGNLSIEHLSGITHEDCEQFSRDFGILLDVEDLVPGTEYTLEVSSPGLDRKLTRAEDYERFKGSLLKLQTFTPVNGNRHWKGRIQSLVEGKLELDLPEAKRKTEAKGKGEANRKKKPTGPATAATVAIDLSNVEKASLVPEF